MIEPWTTEQRCAAAADLCERAAAVLRSTMAVRPAACLLAYDILRARDDDAEGCYCRALRQFGIDPVAIDAAVAAISEGKHPPDSLPAFVERMAKECSLDEDGGFDWVATLERIGAKR